MSVLCTQCCVITLVCSVCVWDRATGSLLSSLPLPGSVCVEQLLCGERGLVGVHCATQDPLGRLSVYRVGQGVADYCYTHHHVRVSSSSLSLCKERLLEGGSTGDLIVVELSSGQEIASLPARLARREGGSCDVLGRVPRQGPGVQHGV